MVPADICELQFPISSQYNWSSVAVHYYTDSRIPSLSPIPTLPSFNAFFTIIVSPTKHHLPGTHLLEQKGQCYRLYNQMFWYADCSGDVSWSPSHTEHTRTVGLLGGHLACAYVGYTSGRTPQDRGSTRNETCLREGGGFLPVSNGIFPIL